MQVAEAFKPPVPFQKAFRRGATSALGFGNSRVLLSPQTSLATIPAHALDAELGPLTPRQRISELARQGPNDGPSAGHERRSFPES